MPQTQNAQNSNWTKPELARLGKLPDVAAGPNVGGQGNTKS